MLLCKLPSAAELLKIDLYCRLIAGMMDEEMEENLFQKIIQMCAGGA
jgi:hypothetical protein